MTIRRIVVDALQVGAEPTGVGRQVQAIGNQLDDLPRGLSLVLRCTEEARPLLAPAFPPGTVVETPLARSRPWSRRILRQQVLAPSRERPDTLLVGLGDQAPLFGRARRMLVVNDVRRLSDRSPTGLEARWYRTLVPRAARRAHALATISEFSRGEIRGLLGLDATVVAHHPPPVVAEAPPVPPGGPLLTVTALRPYKDVETVVDALALLAEPRELLVVGPTEGRGQELLARARARGVANRIRLLGWVPDDELERLYRECAATISASRYEGYGLPVAESLARGRPTIASEIPPHREIGGDAAVYFGPGDAAGLAAAVGLALEDGTRLADAALARSRRLASARPTWRDVILAAASNQQTGATRLTR